MPWPERELAEYDTERPRRRSPYCRSKSAHSRKGSLLYHEGKMGEPMLTLLRLWFVKQELRGRHIEETKLTRKGSRRPRSRS